MKNIVTLTGGGHTLGTQRYNFRLSLAPDKPCERMGYYLQVEAYCAREPMGRHSVAYSSDGTVSVFFDHEDDAVLAAMRL